MNTNFYIESAVLDKNDMKLKNKKKASEIEVYSYDQKNDKDFRIIFFNSINNNLFKELVRSLNIFLEKYNVSKTLVIGLGNSLVLADSLGPKTTSKIIATNQYNDFLTIPKIALFNPEVVERTGIMSFDLIKLVVNELNPECIIIIDSLCTSKLENLNKCIEINDSGIIPGAYIKNNKEINAKTFNIPVISIGIPLVFKYNGNYLTSSNINQVVEEVSDLISKAINKIFIS